MGKLKMNSEFVPLDLLPGKDDASVIIEMEKERISRDLHDEVGQILASIKLNVEAIKLHAINPDVITLAKSIEEKILVGHEAVGDIINNLKPKMIESDVTLNIKGLFLSRLKDSLVKVVFGEMDETIVLSDVKYEQLNYIVQETITNIIMHSRATELRVTFYQKNLRLRLVVEDNGVGIMEGNSKSRLPSNGLDGIKHRAALLNGTVEFSKSSFSNDLPGLKVSLSFPY